jgi:hypothetical protein
VPAKLVELRPGFVLSQDSDDLLLEASRVFGRLRFMRRSLGYEQDPEQVFT